jgi:hypothetical protein
MRGKLSGNAWQLRMKAAGLSARSLAALTGKHETTLSRQFGADKVERYTIAVIVAWELMSEAQRVYFESQVTSSR